MERKQDLLDAIKKGNKKEVEKLIKGIDINNTFHDGKKLLHIAAENGQIDIVKYLVKERKANVNAESIHGTMPLYYAIVGKHKDHQDIANFLIRNGANVNKPDQCGKIPLHYAAENGQERVVDLLITKGKKKNINMRDKGGYTPLYYAFMNNHYEVLKILIKKRANVYIEYEHRTSLLHSTTMETLLHIAAMEGKIDMASLLVTVGKCYVNIRDKKDKLGYTPLKRACEFGHVSIASLLIENGAKFSKDNLEDLIGVYLRDTDNVKVTDLIKNVKFGIFVKKVIPILTSSYRIKKREFSDYINCLRERSIIDSLKKVYEKFKIKELFDLYCMCKLYCILDDKRDLTLSQFQAVLKDCEGLVERFCSEFKKELYRNYLVEEKDNHCQIYEWPSICNNLLELYKNSLVSNVNPDIDCLLSLFYSKVVICNVFLLPEDRDVINDILYLAKQVNLLNKDEYEIVEDNKCSAGSSDLLEEVVVDSFDTNQEKSVPKFSRGTIF